MHDHRPPADPALTFVLPPGLRFPYAIGRPGPHEPTGPRPRPDHGGPAQRTPPRGTPVDRPVTARGGSPRTRAVDAVAAAFLAGEPRPRAGADGPRRAWFDVPGPHHA